MQFKFLAAFALAPLALAYGGGYEDNHALIARELSGLKAQLSSLEARFAEASPYEDEDLFGLSARDAYYDDEFDLSARSLDDDEYLLSLLRRAHTATPTGHGDVRTHSHNQVTPGNINQINTKLGQFRKGSESRTTADKHAEIERKQRNREDRRRP